jgi:hypothetical protein
MISYGLILITSSGLKAASACGRYHDQECGTTPKQEAARLRIGSILVDPPTEVHMKRIGWFVAGAASAAGAVAAGVALRSRRHDPDEAVSEVADVVAPHVDDVRTAPIPVPPPDNSATDAMREQIGDARMRLREKAEAGVPEASGGA